MKKKPTTTIQHKRVLWCWCKLRHTIDLVHKRPEEVSKGEIDSSWRWCDHGKRNFGNGKVLHKVVRVYNKVRSVPTHCGPRRRTHHCQTNRSVAKNSDKEVKKVGRVWIRIFPHIPVTSKTVEVRMGRERSRESLYSPCETWYSISKLMVPRTWSKSALRLGKSCPSKLGL